MKTVTKLSSIIALSAVCAAPTFAYEAGDIILRIGATEVAPDADSDSLALNGSVDALNGFLGAGPSSLDVDDNTQLGINLLYMYNSNWGVELLAATPFEHTASGKGALAGVGDIADVKHLPPTLSAIYYFDSKSKFKPYVGAGINYTIFFDEDLTSGADAVLSSLGQTGGDVELDDSWGLSFQVGADYEIDNNWHVNASVRWIDIDTNAEITFDNGNKIDGDIEIDPYVYTLSVGYKF